MLKVTIDGDGIDEAMKDYVKKMGLDTDGKDVEIKMIAGRGDNGFSAVVGIKSISASTASAGGAKAKPSSTKTSVDDDGKDVIENKPLPDAIAPGSDDTELFGTDPEE